MSELPSNAMLSRLIERGTGMRKPEDCFALTEVATGDERPAGIATSYEYELRFAVGVRYWANHAQRGDARKRAEGMLAHQLYKDVISDLYEIRQAVSDGDRLKALRGIAELQSRLVR